MGSKANKKCLRRWLESFEQVSAALQKHGDLLQLLQAGGGICKVPNFLPKFVAEGILETLEEFSETQWNVSNLQLRPKQRLMQQ